MSYKIEMGEYAVAAYLKLIVKCDVVDYKVRKPVPGRASLNEIDVIGFDFKNKTAYVCEAKTHIRGLDVGTGNADTIAKIEKQFANMRSYAKEYLREFVVVFQ